MAMETIFFKEHEQLIVPSNNTTILGQFPSGPSGPWWSNNNSFGNSQPFLGESFAAKSAGIRGAELGFEKGISNHFNMFPGDCKFSGDGLKSQACSKFTCGDQFCGVFSYGQQISGRVMLPLNLAVDDGPIYVNAKQYRGIIRRRQSRAKAAILANKIPKSRKPYMHESRHLHAMRRPRGCGGRFLNTKKTQKGKNLEFSYANNSGSPQSSEVLQSESGARKEGLGPNSPNNMAGSEATSMFINAMGRGIPMHPDWIAMDRGLINLMA